jgi:hypothetical protein
MKTLTTTKILLLTILLTTIGCITVNTPTPEPAMQNPTPSQPMESRVNLQGNSSWNWQQVSSPTITPTSLKSPIAILDDRGYLHLFWDSPASSGSAFIYHSYYDGITWTAPTPIAPTLGSSELRFASLIKSNGIIHLLWYNTLKLGGPFRLMYASFDGTKWSQESEIMRMEKDINLRGVLSIDEKGVHAIVESANTMSPDINYLTLSGTSWSAPEIITPPALGLFIWKYYPDNLGGIRFYGRDAFNNKLTYAYWQNGNSTIKNIDIAFPRHDDFFVDAQGNHYTYWTAGVPVPGGTVEGAYYQCIDNNLTVWADQVLSGESEVITKPIVAQSASKTAMLWVDKEQQTQLLLPKNCSESDLFTLPLQPLEKPSRKPLALAVSDTPNKICLISKIGYSDTPLEVYCADIQ